MNATAYRDMIHLSRPISRHPKMSVENRAKLFTPFSALRGFDIEILTKEQDRLLVSQVTLDADQQVCGFGGEEGHGKQLLSGE